MKTTYYVSGLDCAHCAMKIEEKLNTLPKIQSAVLSFTSGELRVVSDADDETLTNLISSVIDQLEPEASLTKQQPKHQKDPHCHDKHCAKHLHDQKKPNLLRRIPLEVFSLAISLLLLIPALLFKNTLAASVLFFLSGLSAGFRVFLKGLKKLFRLSIDENFLLLVAFAAAFGIGEYFEACLVVILFAVGEFLEDRAVENSKRSIEALTQIRPETANLMKDGVLAEISCEDVQIGDIILVKPGERVPLDCIVLSGNSQADNAAITGESIPIAVAEGSQLLSGGINLTAALECRVTHSFTDSTASRIIEMVKDSAAKKGKAEAFISRFAKIYTPIVIIAALLFAIIPPLIGLGSFSHWLYTALILLVAACPCAMVISVPLTFFSCIGAASKQGVLIKGGKYAEALAKADAIALDKTGTLTSGKLSLGSIKSCQSTCPDEQLLLLAAACECYSDHPIAKAVTGAVEAARLAVLDICDYQEIRGMGTVATINGSRYLCGAARLMEQNEIPVNGLPSANVYLANAETKELLGYLTVKDTLRPESKNTLEQLKQLGFKSALLLSGDRDEAVKECAEELGIAYKSELLPDGKVEEVERFKQSHRKTVFVGDGINDAPVLAAADIGIAMGLGADSAIEAADVVLVSGNLSALPSGIRLAKKAMRIIYFNIVFALAAKFIVFLLALFGLGQMWMAVIADVGVSIFSVINAARLLKKQK